MRVPHLFWLVGPCVLFAIGFLLNAGVMAVNGGSMPVEWPKCVANQPLPSLPSGEDTTAAGYILSTIDPDPFHSCMNPKSHLKFLADWIVIRDDGIYSPGDFLEMTYGITVFPSFLIWIVLIICDKKGIE
jgi:hypothetical protein